MNSHETASAGHRHFPEHAAKDARHAKVCSNFSKRHAQTQRLKASDAVDSIQIRFACIANKAKNHQGKENGKWGRKNVDAQPRGEGLSVMSAYARGTGRETGTTDDIFG